MRVVVEEVEVEIVGDTEAGLGVLEEGEHRPAGGDVIPVGVVPAGAAVEVVTLQTVRQAGRARHGSERG